MALWKAVLWKAVLQKMALQKMALQKAVLQKAVLQKAELRTAEPWMITQWKGELWEGENGGIFLELDGLSCCPRAPGVPVSRQQNYWATVSVDQSVMQAHRGLPDGTSGRRPFPPESECEY